MNEPNEFEIFFHNATGFVPYPYQHRWALGEAWPDLVSVPTGLGKTAATVLSWIWRRRFSRQNVRAATPRRLVYCLPMRVLVEQTSGHIALWLKRLKIDQDVKVFSLLGGEVDDGWDLDPSLECILVGTQDQLLSRALNRGFTMSRFRWPIHFALLNNDCLWVMDEVQLMGVGLTTSVQLQSFRSRFGTILPVKSTWMSATIRPNWLTTVDFDPDRQAGAHLQLNDEDLEFKEVQKRLHASKTLETLAPASKDGHLEREMILGGHSPGSLTLVVVNTVARAVGLFSKLKKNRAPLADLLLIHSRFRPPERAEKLNRLIQKMGPEGRIVISTQVIEAGVDISAARLFTDLAPWASLVQRFGRVNRGGEMDAAKVTVFDPNLSRKGAALPYEPEELEQARDLLHGLADVGPANLPEVGESRSIQHVIRERDMVDLFDTTPDLAGADVDVSRFIRDSEDRDVHVFWRTLKEKTPSPDEPAPRRDELCPAPLAEVRKANRSKWRWDHLEKRWTRAAGLFPGLVVMLRQEEGGYSSEMGFTGNQKDRPSKIEPAAKPAEANDDDDLTRATWQTLADHTQAVVDEVLRLIRVLPVVDETFRANLTLAARWHDGGKAHPVFQRSLPEHESMVQIWAKAPTTGPKYGRPGFRHELASSLAMLQLGKPDLAAYLVAAHHGKVRLSIRSLAHEHPPLDPAQRFARGIWDGDPLGPADLGDAVTLPHVHLDLSLMEMGEGPLGDSWLSRMLALRDAPEIGPFRLAFLETVLRLADWRASAASKVSNE